jgi:hypothetical protein
MSSGIVWRLYVGFVADINIKILRVAPTPRGWACLSEITTHAQGGLFISVRIFFLV